MRGNLGLLLIFLVSISACRKDHINNQILPAETQNGKNTIGFTLNGQVWLPYYTCSLGSDPCGKILARYGTGFGGRANHIGFSFTRRANGKFSFLQISPILAISTITSTGNKIDSVSVGYFSDERKNFANVLPGSNLNITKLDTLGKIISGTFHFFLSEYNNPGNTIEIKDGRFDLVFNACLCD